MLDGLSSVDGEPSYPGSLCDVDILAERVHHLVSFPDCCCQYQGALDSTIQSFTRDGHYYYGIDSFCSVFVPHEVVQ
jgi:hypothetical protein